MNMYKIFTDGGSRGNPGKSACAFAVYLNDKEVASGAFDLGIGTNNNAEYFGVIKALEWIKKQQIKNSKINFFLDSELVVKQITGVYKIKDINLMKLSLIIRDLKTDNDFSFTHVPRGQNKRADFLLNQKLDLPQESH